MSFGNLNIIINKTNLLLEKKKNNELDLNKISILKNKIYNKLKKEYPDIDYIIINQIFDRLIKYNYKLNNNITFENGTNCFRDIENTYIDIVVPSKYIILEHHFQKLYNLPQPVQRSKEWFDYRYNRITASDTAAAIDMNPYEPVENFILKKCDPNFPFKDNDTVFHGKKYEPIATMIYEHIYNSRVFEFGALPSEKYDFLGASPDGIASKYTLDNNFSDRLGTMLEIKCPVTRDIITKGNIVGEICPFYYYCQVQQQLACCELDVCDFWQCKIIEYNYDYNNKCYLSNLQAREKYLMDDCSNCVNFFSDKGLSMNVDKKLKKGLFLEFYPKNFIPEDDDDKIEWKGKYIMPKRLDMNEQEYDTWLLDNINNWHINFPNNDYYFHKIIYWKLEVSHNVSVIRDDSFFSGILPILKNTWDKVLYYRENKDKLEDLKKIANKRTKYLRNMNTTINIHNDILLKKKLLFLDPKVKINISDITPKSNYTKNNNYKKYKKPTIEVESDNEISDNTNCDFID
jgi:putative phage-type endonuclease